MGWLPSRKNGFTLVELLVVVAIIGLLVGLLMPAVQSAREAARRMSCSNNLRQLGMAMHNYESAVKRIPPSACVNPKTTANASWSIHGRLFPYLEQNALANQIDLSRNWSNYPVLNYYRVPTYVCPSDPRSGNARDTSATGTTVQFFLYPTTYAFNLGTWFVYDPVTNRGGDGVTHPNSELRFSAVADGLSRTLWSAEVHAWQAYTRNGGPPSIAMPQTVQEASAAAATGDRLRLLPDRTGTGRTEWTNGHCHHSGFTVTLSPNTFVPLTHNGIVYNVDYNSQQEGASTTRPSYAILTSRSWHTSMVQVGLMDGSVQTISDAIDLQIWRALGTRAQADISELGL